MGRGRTPSPSATEEVNPRTTNLDRLASGEILERILAEDRSVPEAVRATLPALTRAADRLVAALDAGGRWFNLGAGTSGRIGLLDAAEIPPTFGFEPERVQGVLAGGEGALLRAVEGAEDDPAAAASELARRDFGAGDVLVALPASGRTPFALGGVEYARECGATTICVTCSAGSPLAELPEIPIVVVVGPEVIAGSTRMKGGLAQKMVLHALSTTVMVRLGRVRGNLMAELHGTNSKLRQRAVTIVSRLGHVTPDEARTTLQSSDGSVAAALEQLRVPRRRGYPK